MGIVLKCTAVAAKLVSGPRRPGLQQQNHEKHRTQNKYIKCRMQLLQACHHLQKTAAVRIAAIRDEGERCRHAEPPPRNRDEVLSGEPFDTRNDVVFGNIRAIRNGFRTLRGRRPSEIDNAGRRTGVRRALQQWRHSNKLQQAQSSTATDALRLK